MIRHSEEHGLRIEVCDGGCLMAARDEPHSRVLHKLQLGNIRRFGVWEPDGSCVGENGLHQHLVGNEESSFIVAPIGATDSFKNVQALVCFGALVVYRR
jgi:hypothetical protein